MIVENKDTYFRIKNGIYGTEYDCVIYGAGWKIIRAFSLAEETGIMETDTIEYFGDIDPEGFAIYYELKTQYASYSIRLKMEFYEKILEAVRESERKPGKSEGRFRIGHGRYYHLLFRNLIQRQQIFAENDVERSVLYPAGSTDSCRRSRGGKYYKENQK